MDSFGWGEPDGSDPDLHLVADGRIVRPATRDGGSYCFVLKTIPQTLRLASRTNVPRRLAPANADDRRLGVGIGRIVLNAEATSLQVEAAHPLLEEGFYGAESGFRWTDGDALISPALLAPLGPGPVTLRIEVVIALPAYAPPSYPVSAEQARWAEAIEIHADADRIQQMPPRDLAEHYEGIAYSASGRLLAVAAAGGCAVVVYRRAGNGRFGATPYCRLTVGDGVLEYAHDVTFARVDGREILAVIQRGGFLSAWRVEETADSAAFAPLLQRVALEGMAYTDALAFMPPDNGYLAVVAFWTGVIRFYRGQFNAGGDYVLTAQASFQSDGLTEVDGIAFSADGEWLATTSHATQSVVVFRRSSARGEPPVYDPAPAAIIGDAALFYPHSLAFCRDANHLVVTSAGANTIGIYAAEPEPDGGRWTQSSIASVQYLPRDVFDAVNQANPMEGGGKGVAAFDGEIAVCSPEVGVRIYDYSLGRAPAPAAA